MSPGCSSAEEHGLVHLAAGVRLHVGEVAAEELLGALDRQFLGDVDELAAAIVALARIALGILVGHDRALRFEHGAGDDVFRGDQLDLMALATELGLDGEPKISGSASARLSRRSCRSMPWRSILKMELRKCWRAINTVGGRLPRSHLRNFAVGSKRRKQRTTTKAAPPEPRRDLLPVIRRR